MGTRIVVGLGNPGEQYRDTRHNIGYAVADDLADRSRIRWKGGKGDYFVALADTATATMVLIKPTTFMNGSGLAVVQALEHFRGTIEDLLVVVDDFALPLGSVRIRSEGTDGGHNGLRSVIYHLATTQFSRLRCGIGITGMPPKDEMATFVLSRFGPDELEQVNTMVRRASDACLSWSGEGITRTMNKFNT